MTHSTAVIFAFLAIWTSMFPSAVHAYTLARQNPDTSSEPPPPPPPPPPVILEAMNIHHLDRSLEDKYFHEPGNDDILGHYDTRYFKGVVTDEERSETLTHMMRAYLNYFRHNNLQTWIAHGTLLGWWWNSRIFPWDWDIDTQVTDGTLTRMALQFNQTIVKYESKDGYFHRDYILDVNPWAAWRDRGPGHNVIDARWIDTHNGLYIDITALSELDPDQPGMWECKNFHRYHTDDLFPLRESVYEDATVTVPFRYYEILIEEYSKESLSHTKFHNHTWAPQLERWIPDQNIL